MSSTTEDLIINETVDFIKTYGYEKLSLRKIASQMNMTTGAFYKHFANKEELFDKVSQQIYSDILHLIPLNSNESSLVQLKKVVHSLLKLFESMPNEMNFIFFNPNLSDAYEEKNADIPFFDLITKLTHQINPGVLTDKQLFYQIWSFVQGYSILLKNKATHYDAQMVETTLNEFAQAGGN